MFLPCKLEKTKVSGARATKISGGRGYLHEMHAILHSRRKCSRIVAQI